jgi:hypothetical protein
MGNLTISTVFPRERERERGNLPANYLELEQNKHKPGFLVKNRKSGLFFTQVDEDTNI